MEIQFLNINTWVNIVRSYTVSLSLPVPLILPPHPHSTPSPPSTLFLIFLLSINLYCGVFSISPPCLFLPSFSSMAPLYFSIMSKCLISAKLWLMPSPLVVLPFLMSKISLNFSLAPSLTSPSLRLSLATTALLHPLFLHLFSSLLFFLSFTTLSLFLC